MDRYSLRLIGSLTLILTETAIFAQSPTEITTNPKHSLSIDDPEVQKLIEAHRKRIAKLEEELLADVAKLGVLEAPAYLSELRRKSTIWNIRINGFASHSLYIKSTDRSADPKWEHSLGTPPLAPRSVLEIAERTMRGSFGIMDVKYKLERISLVPLLPNEGVWYWVASYQLEKDRWEKDFDLSISMTGEILTKYDSDQ